MNGYRIIGVFVVAVMFTSVVAIAHAADADKHRLGKPTAKDKTDIRGIMKSHFANAINGHGIGITPDGAGYVVTKFHLVKVRQMPARDISDLLDRARDENKTWNDIKTELRNLLANAQVSDRGRIEVNGEVYLLSGITRSAEDNAWTANILEKLDIEACRAANKTLGTCEEESPQVGSLSLTFDKVIGANRAYKGSLTFEGTTYNQVALIHGRGGAS